MTLQIQETESMSLSSCSYGTQKEVCPLTDQMMFLTGLFILLFAVCFGVVSVFAVRLARAKTELRFMEFYGEKPEAGKRNYAAKNRKSAEEVLPREAGGWQKEMAAKSRKSAEGVLPREAGGRQEEMPAVNRSPEEGPDGDTTQTTRITPHT